MRATCARFLRGLSAVSVLVLASTSLAAQTPLYQPRFLFSFGTEGPGSGQFRTNYGLAIDKVNGWVYVTDTGFVDKSIKPHPNKFPGENHRVEKFDLEGNFLLAFGEFGNAPGQFKRPFALAVDDEDSVYVGGEAGDRVQKFDANGNFILQFGSRGSGPGQFNNPYGIAYQAGFLYIVDRVNGNIQKFTKAGVFVEQFGVTGTRRQKLNLPVAIAIDTAGNFYVADVKANPGDDPGHTFSAIDRIVKYGPDKKFIRAWGSFGSGPTELDYPRGVAIDTLGNLFVSDRNNDRVQIFAPNGALLGSFGVNGHGSGEFVHNRQLDIVGNRLYVADSNNSRVQVFDITANGSTGDPRVIPPTWTRFRHDAYHTGRSPYRGPQTADVAWTFPTTHRIWPSPALAPDGTIYMAGQDNFLRAFNPDGSSKWEYRTGDHSFSSPAVGADGTIYIGSNDGKFYAVYPDGRLKWSFTTGAKIVAPPNISPDEQTILIGSNDNHLYALDTAGNLRWSYATPKAVPGAPAFGNQGQIYVASGQKLIALTADGQLRWSYTTSGWVGASPAVGADGTVYIGSWDHTLYALGSNGQLKWSRETGGRIESSVAIGSDGTIYVGSVDEYLYALDPANGAVKWRFLTPGCEDCTCHLKPGLHPNCNEIEGSPAVDSDGTIFIGSHDNHMYAINLDGTLKWRHQAGDWVNSSPAIGANGTIYFGSRDKSFYAIGANP